VQRRDLVATDTESGTLSYAAPQTVYTQLAGVITWLPAVGKVIRPGHALLTINNYPVLLMNGTTPAYRDLKPTDTSGPDVYELNRNLVALGYEPEWITANDLWQPGTTAGIKQLQEHLGETQTGSLALGQIIFLPGQQLIQSQALTVGAAASTQANVLTTSSTKLIVTVDLSPSSQSEAAIGERVGVELPNGTTVGGRVTAVSPVAQNSATDGGGSGSSGGGAGGSGSSTVPVTIVLDKRAKGGGLDQASVSVNFIQSKARNVLSVPVTSLLATSGSSFAVQQASRPHKLIKVQTGLFAAGYVEISGSGIYPGLRVTDSQG
jgi:peptidoglycan hydrolase-like protein with peptidoglycan-binding domain